jgi:hypothetical protein
MSSDIELNNYKLIPIILDILYKVAHKNNMTDDTKFEIIKLILNVYDLIDKDNTDHDINFTYMINDFNDIKKEFENQKKNNTSVSLCINQIYAIFLYSKAEL